MSDDKDSAWDGWNVISTYQPDIIPNERRLQACTDEEFAGMLAHFTGTQHYHVDSGLLLTDGAKWLLDATGAYALLRTLLDLLPVIAREEDAFVVIDLQPDGTITIHDGREGRHYLALARLGVRVPCAVRLFTGAFGRHLVLILASEY